MIWSILSTIILQAGKALCYNQGMNLKTFDKSTRLLKQADLAAHGLPLQGNTNATVIGILDCTQNGSEAIIQNLICGIRQGGGLPLTFHLTNFNALQRMAPATAKYAANYRDLVASNTAGIVRTQMLDGIVAVVDNYVMGLGVLIGCTNTNCPVLIMPIGVNTNADNSIVDATGKIALRAIKAGEVEQVADNYVHHNGTAPSDTLTMDFYRLAEAFELLLPNTATMSADSGTTLNLALTVATTILQRADDIITTKRLISKRTINEKLEQYKNAGGSVAGLLLFQSIFDLVDLKVTPNLYTPLKTTLADQAYAVSQNIAPLTMAGQAWVYHTIADAMTALSSNAIDSGIIVLQNCTGCDVSIVAHTIAAMQKTATIALLTDGLCAATPVLTVAHISPDGYANQDFANIQNGDNLEIDVTKGRININVNSRDMKLRAKRNIVKKHEIYF
ncbi:MAG: dihydroxy-acid dehydratase [Prevotella sp.]|nr:dihydroxy-acid dehydratase [Prevotella sp.]